ncbi:MAG: hypothetical protein IKU25_02845 [Clostridia bacterium]|nr:hypothetical protein [Clostridia bacterium]
MVNYKKNENDAQISVVSKNIKKHICRIVASMVAALMIFSLCACGSRGYEKVVKNYVNYIKHFTVIDDNLRSLAPESYWDSYAKEYGFEDADAFFEGVKEGIEKELEDLVYNVDVDYEISQEEKLTSRELERICEEIEDEYEEIYPEFTEGYTFKFKMEAVFTLDYDGDGKANTETESKTYIITAVKMKGNWYLIEDGRWLVDSL